MSERPNPQQELSETIRAAAAGEGENPIDSQQTNDFSGRVEYKLFKQNGEDFTDDYRTDYRTDKAQVSYGNEHKAVNISVDSEFKHVNLSNIGQGSQIVEDNRQMKVDTEFSDGYGVNHTIDWNKNKHDSEPVIRTTRVDSEGNATETFKKMSPRQQRAAARLARLSFGIKEDEGPVQTEKAA
jgi:hypothetical protein